MIDQELVLTTDAPANGGSCVARHDGRVVFVRYALPGEQVRVRITAERGSYWHGECVEVLEPAAARIDSLCPIAGVDGAGCCDLAFADPAVARALKGAVVSNQLARLGGYEWEGSAEPVGDDGPTGWRTRVRLDVGADGRAGFHRYHSDELVTDLQCGQLPAGMIKGLTEQTWRPGDHLHVVADDDGVRHVVSTGRGHRPQVMEGDYHATQWVGRRRWQIPVTSFWQAHRRAAALYSALVGQWAQADTGMTAWDLYGGAGIFAAALAETVGETGRVISADTSRAATGAARAALADLPQVSVRTDSVRRVLSDAHSGADVAVLDPPRAGAGREVIEALAAAGVPRIVHIGCEAASFARDIGLYRGQGYAVEQIRVFDAFPLTHHVECVALLTR
ncbi:class I SAM-dependent RNA methyltransferase [[Mycobacterium] holstebronense]|uniref:TRAM domain-containing protein n=1 Tax=[Mycobacterium] holstebronense TaxID=3064288 RepID=A0ABN9NFM4_9MYCO|nr:TRAM domain-containing protein [Mycolicibacter sp. MU0102]CAJ1505558.1 TRAM domain-containing protein [Mycolicibacter sp. MU0102]